MWEAEHVQSYAFDSYGTRHRFCCGQIFYVNWILLNFVTRFIYVNWCIAMVTGGYVVVIWRFMNITSKLILLFNGTIQTFSVSGFKKASLLNLIKDRRYLHTF